jgi:pimeloyl-ACP methyl ester carboxylesterase
MAVAMVNGVRLFYEVSGAGEVPLVFVHGSWGSHHNWDLSLRNWPSHFGFFPTTVAATVQARVHLSREASARMSPTSRP